MFRANKIAAHSEFWSDDVVPDTTPMKDFYRGKVIFLTGGTGFLGQIYVEKLLRYVGNNTTESLNFGIIFILHRLKYIYEMHVQTDAKQK